MIDTTVYVILICQIKDYLLLNEFSLKVLAVIIVSNFKAFRWPLMIQLRVPRSRLRTTDLLLSIRWIDSTRICTRTVITETFKLQHLTERIRGLMQ